MDDFEAAFWRVTSTIGAPAENLKALLPELRALASSGSRRAEEAVRRHLPEGVWRWPDYEAQSAVRDEEFRRADIKDIRRSDIWGFLSSMKAAELRDLFRRYAPPGTPLPGKGCAQIVPVLGALLSPEQSAELLSLFRQQALAEISKPSAPDYDEMVILLYSRISFIAHNIGRYRQLADREMQTLLPRRKFHWADGGKKECRKFNGKVLPHKEAEAVFPLVPCACLFCRCRISAER